MVQWCACTGMALRLVAFNFLEQGLNNILYFCSPFNQLKFHIIIIILFNELLFKGRVNQFWLKEMENSLDERNESTKSRSCGCCWSYPTSSNIENRANSPSWAMEIFHIFFSNFICHSYWPDLQDLCMNGEFTRRRKIAICDLNPSGISKIISSLENLISIIKTLRKLR